jgi:hypothetical protein
VPRQFRILALSYFPNVAAERHTPIAVLMLEVGGPFCCMEQVPENNLISAVPSDRLAVVKGTLQELAQAVQRGQTEEPVLTTMREWSNSLSLSVNKTVAAEDPKALFAEVTAQYLLGEKD